jgi:16S rRNA (guanine966-N2)-methyltransferase
VEIIFLDPPYEAAEEYEATLGFIGRRTTTLLNEGAVVIAEHAKKQPLAERYGMLTRYRVLEQGDAALSFYSVPG